MPKPLSTLAYIFGVMKGKIAEYENPAKTIAKGEGREGNKRILITRPILRERSLV